MLRERCRSAPGMMNGSASSLRRILFIDIPMLRSQTGLLLKGFLVLALGLLRDRKLGCI